MCVCVNVQVRCANIVIPQRHRVAASQTYKVPHVYVRVVTSEVRAIEHCRTRTYTNQNHKDLFFNRKPKTTKYSTCGRKVQWECACV